MPNPLDVLVGSRIRRRRVLLGISQGALGKALGITYQQIQRHERGANRIGARRLFEFALVLGVSVDHFFEEDSVGPSRRRPGGNGDRAMEPDITANRETLTLVKAYARIKSPTQRKTLADLMTALARQ